ncbi:choline BCCT transporter BetT [Marinobacter nanhaiticus D15-8W]|uniref:BCCT family transporter n=1 Tax=Marinobacter nanhaiticus D15-8W TaxID=626887 RepID=N6WVH1_9GAMM|nr:choline BCCT transporter BetT [Marinobacter nanhaiticus]ENO12838.1 BCCT family transporter [Marinobacter nanhaiticus D15-8W]BES70188.1 choline BCCT transporter BetT [Marinobacter nanhaiticus D15-8W]
MAEEAGSSAGKPSHEATSEEAHLNPIVFYGSVIGIVAFAVWTMVFTESASAVITAVLGWISNTFGWFYFIAVVVYLVFVICIGLSRYGKLRLGPAHSTPDFNVLTWAAMLFSAGIGIDLLFFCIAEPVTMFLAPPTGNPDEIEAARQALQLTFLHWGLSGWGVYTLVGMALAFFSYRHGLPLTIRSTLYPIFGKRIKGVIGHTVDTAAVLGTVFGIATSLGIGIIQLNFGLNYMFGVPDGTLTQAILAVLIVIFATISAVTGVDKGIRRLSEFNMLLALMLMLFVLFSGKTLFLLNALVMNIGDYLSEFVSLSMNTYAFDPPTDWLNAWTVFFWAWWIAWGPFVGLFLARISRGRTIGQFVAGTLILPLTFMMAWMSIMGNSAIDLVINDTGVANFGQQAMENPGSSIYLFMESYPWVGLTTIVVTILAVVFFVTSGDSGSLVLSNLTSVLRDPNHDAPAWMRILWAAVIGLLTLALLIAGGLTALQSTVVIMGLPFAFVLFLMMVGVFRALRLEGLKEDSQMSSLAGHLSGRVVTTEKGMLNWRQRLTRSVSFPDHKQARTFLVDIAKPAMGEISEVLVDKGFKVRVEEDNGVNEHVGLTVDLGGEQNFTYQVWPRKCLMPAFSIRATRSDTHYYRLEVHIGEGGQGYDLFGYTREQVIADILDQYERHLYFLHSQRELPGGDAIMPENTTSSEDEGASKT